MRRKVAAALVVALALVLAGCGGSEKTEVVSRQVAVKRLEAACLAGERAAQAKMRGTSDKRTYVSAVRDEMQTILDRVGNVEPTGSARRAYDAYKATLRDRIDAVGRITSADDADWQRAIARERHLLDTASIRGHDAIVALGANHDCI